MPDLIGCDMGSIDIGPYYLGSGELATAPAATQRDLRKVLLGVSFFQASGTLDFRGPSSTDSPPAWVAYSQAVEASER